MSLLLAYHDSKRALVCCDDRAIRFDESGQAIALAERVPKFVCVGALIFTALGRSDVAATLMHGTARLFADYSPPICAAADALPGILRKAFGARPARDTRNVPLGVESDGVETALLGFDHASGRVRSFIFASVDDFVPIETTRDPFARIFALGAYGPDDRPLLQRLTERMERAGRMDAAWIADSLKHTIGKFHEKRPVAIGEPSYFAALDAHGFVSLPEDFPPLPSPAPEAQYERHLVTTIKENALAAAGRFFVGSIYTPRAGTPDTIGNADGGATAQVGMLHKLSLTVVAAGSGTFGTGSTLSNASSGIDNDLTTFAELKATGNGSNNSAFVTYYGPPAIARRYSSVTLKLNFTVVANNLNFSAGAGQDGIILTAVNNLMATGGNYLHTTYAAGSGAQANQTISVTIPPTDNLGGLNVSVFVGAVSGATSGGIEVKFNDAWIEAIE